MLADRRFWFVGIGGAGMSALALVARAWGAEVGGSDRARSSYVERLEEAGVRVTIGHEAANVPDGAEVIVSSAIAADNPEVAGREVRLRGELLAELVELRPSIVVAGAHGKTTTAGMIAFCLDRLGEDPAFLIGGEIAQLDGNARAGGGWLVAEGDESDRSLELLRPRIAVLTNVELDHHATFASEEEVRELFERRALEETPKSDDPAFHRSRWWTLLSNASLLQAAKVEAERHQFTVEIDNSCDDWDYLRAANYLLDRLYQLRKNAERVCLISGGEVTVKVTNGGVGGRNQQFALACAKRISGENITVLSAGTDGIDGNSPAAGAIVDGTTISRATARGLDVEKHIASFHAYPFLEALGDAIVTGSTGNNLRDLRILMAY